MTSQARAKSTSSESFQTRIEADGTVHLGSRTIPAPQTVSAEARALLAISPFPDPSFNPHPMWKDRAVTDQMIAQGDAMTRSAFPVNIVEEYIDGVRTHRVTPLVVPEKNSDRVLINLHGGAFVMGAGMVSEAIPIAHMAEVTVIAVDYRLAPEHPFPAAVDDAIAVYRALLKTHRPENIGIYGTSAGGFLTAQTMMKIRALKLPQPAVLGMFTSGGDLSKWGEATRLFTLFGFFGHVMPQIDDEVSEIRAYRDGHDATDPLFSPVYGDLSGFPPSLLMTGTRDVMLSDATLWHRALRRAGNEADLFVFEAMPHAHWMSFHLPEAREALDIMVKFFDSRLGRKA